MKNRIFWALLIIVAFGIMIPVSMSFYNDYEVFTKGKLINVVITSVPDLSGGGAKSSGLMHFDYNLKNYYITVKGNSDSYHEGDTIQLRYLDGIEQYKDLFLFPNNNPNNSYITALALLLFGASGCIYYFIKNPRM